MSCLTYRPTDSTPPFIFCCALQLKDGSYRKPSAEPYPELVRWPTKPSLPTDGKYHQMLVFSSWVWRLPIVKHCSCLSFKCSILDCPRATSESHLMFGWGSLFKGHIINSWHPNRELCLENFHSPCQDRKQSEVSWEKKYYTAVPIYPLKALTAWCL